MDSTALPHLHNAIKRGDLKAVLDAADESNVNAVYNGHTAMTYALDVSADDNVITKALLTSPHFDPNAGNRHQRTPLFEAAKHGRDEIVTCLLRMGAKVDICDHRGMTPLGICAVYNRYGGSDNRLKKLGFVAVHIVIAGFSFVFVSLCSVVVLVVCLVGWSFYLFICYSFVLGWIFLGGGGGGGSLLWFLSLVLRGFTI